MDKKKSHDDSHDSAHWIPFFWFQAHARKDVSALRAMAQHAKATGQARRDFAGVSPMFFSVLFQASDLIGGSFFVAQIKMDGLFHSEN